jgi:hypothetical protein
MPSVRQPRGTLAAFVSLAGASGLSSGQLYVLTDVGRVAVALSQSTYTVLPQMGVDTPSIAIPVRVATPKIAGCAAGVALTTLALTASRQYFIPFTFGAARTLTNLRISVSTLLAGTAAIGIYSNTVFSGSDTPGTKLVEVTGLDTGTAGDKTGAATLTFQPGALYWASVIASAGCTVRAMAVGGVAPGMSSTIQQRFLICGALAPVARYRLPLPHR